MSLIEIKHGTEAKSQVLNDNFDYLEDLIVSSIQSFDSKINSANNNISNITSNMAAIQENIVPTGTVIWHSKVPSGYLRCDGSLISRTEYSNLFETIGTTFGAGDGVTTFTLPKLTDGRFIEGHTSAGTYIEAGLPNIVGTMTNAYRGAVSGCFYYNGESSNGGDDKTTSNVGFNASLSNSIYGKSSTVQPEALTLIPCIKY